MSNTKSPFSFEIISTKDQSPTLSLNGGEKMHSLEGALSETLYIYAPCVEQSLKAHKPALLSMGLGLGYNEILTSALALKTQRKTILYSYEIVPELRNSFTHWLTDQVSELSVCYDQILTLIAKYFEWHPLKIKSHLRELFEAENFRVFSEVEPKNSYGHKFNGIMYDAFSSKSSPALWEEDFLNQFIDEYCDLDFCTLSTYAATGALKRALLSHGFTLEKKKGFGMKRESTFAYIGTENA